MIPEWFVEAGHVSLGIAIDDGCLVLLTRQPADDDWLPTDHIPPAVIPRLAEIAEAWATACCSAGCSGDGSPSPQTDALLGYWLGERET